MIGLHQLIHALKYRVEPLRHGLPRAGDHRAVLYQPVIAPRRFDHAIAQRGEPRVDAKYYHKPLNASIG